MAKLVWDAAGDRWYESGIDRGVIYLPGNETVPWNGLTAVVEKIQKERSSVHFDGMKINDLVSGGHYSGTISAITYPDELLDIEGLAEVTRGAHIGFQPPKFFNFSYRVRVGNDLDADAGHKIHILYNVSVVPSDKAYNTVSGDPGVAEFEWDISAIPEEIPGFRPTAYVVVDTSRAPAALVAGLEDMLYGTPTEDPSLPTIQELIDYIVANAGIQVVDNGDGTWTLNTEYTDVVSVDQDGRFTLTDVNATYIDDDTYMLSNS